MKERSKWHDADWREIGDPTPVELPLNFKAPPSIHEMIKMYVRNELSKAAHDNGYETFEESNDFDEDDDEPMPRSAHEYAPEDEELLTRALADVKKEARSMSKGEESERGTKGVDGKASKSKAVAGGLGGNGKTGKGNEGAGSEDVADDSGGQEGADGREVR